VKGADRQPFFFLLAAITDYFVASVGLGALVGFLLTMVFGNGANNSDSSVH
jgi:hypothetical protein